MMVLDINEVIKNIKIKGRRQKVVSLGIPNHFYT